MNDTKTTKTVLSRRVLFCLGLFFLFVNFFPYSIVYEKLNAFSGSGRGMLAWGDLYFRIRVTLQLFAIFLFAGGIYFYLTQTCLRDLLKKYFLITVCEGRVFFQWLIRILCYQKFLTLTIFLITLVGLFLRLKFLSLPMHGDEGLLYVSYVSKSWYVILGDYYEQNHFLQTLLTCFFCFLFGSSPEVVRLSAFVPGVLAIPATAFLSLRLFKSGFVALIAAVFMACSSFAIEYSTNARGYSLLTLSFVIAMGFAVLATKRDRKWTWAGISLFLAVGMLAHPGFIYPFIIVNVWLLYACKTGDVRYLKGVFIKKYIQSMMGASALTFLGYFPILLLSGPEKVLNHRVMQRWVTQGLTRIEAYRTIPRYGLHLLQVFTRDYPQALSWFMFAVLILYFVFHRKVSKFRTPFFIVAVISSVLFYVIHPHFLIGFDRLFLYLAPVFFVAVAGGIGVITPERLNNAKYTSFIVAIFFVVSLGGFAFKHVNIGSMPNLESIRLADGNEIAQFLNRQLRPGDMISSPNVFGYNLNYYFLRNGFDSSYIKGFTVKTDEVSRLLLVINLQTDGIIKTHDLVYDEKKYSPAKLIKKFPHSEVYELLRKDS